MSELDTPRLLLRLQSPQQVMQMLQQMPPEVRAQVSEQWASMALGAAEADPWVHGFQIVRKDDCRTVGHAGFKGPPDGNHSVEIAYGIDEEFRGLGFATETARCLTDFALRHAGIDLVIAHTLPQNSESQRVLEKCGFQNIGEVIDPDDGRVWRWECRTENLVR